MDLPHPRGAHCRRTRSIDLDPGTETTWDELLILARLHRTALEHLQVRGYPKVTGQRGIQIWIPIVAGPSFSETRAWVEQISRAVGATAPDLVSWTWTKRDREGRARLDYTQNAINKTLVAPYSARPAPGAPVSVPITWDELDDPDLRPDRWTIRTVLDRLASTSRPHGADAGRRAAPPTAGLTVATRGGFARSGLGYPPRAPVPRERRKETAVPEDNSLVRHEDEDDQPSARQLLHAATGDRDAEAKALADRAGDDVTENDAKEAVELAHGDIQGEPRPERDVATPEDARAVAAQDD